jgi:hypothetical protein
LGSTTCHLFCPLVCPLVFLLHIWVRVGKM